MSGCSRISLADLGDYAAGDLAAAEAAALEEHLFACDACAARAAAFDATVCGIVAAVRSGEVDGFVTDAILNRLSRDGVRVRSFTLSPGAVVPCAVWDGDELMALRLLGDFGEATEVTLVQRQAGIEISRISAPLGPGARGEVIVATPASLARQLPVVELDLVLTARTGDHERPVGEYRLVHGGSLQR